MVPLLLLLLLWFCFAFGTATSTAADKNVYWDISAPSGILQGQNLRLRKLIHPNNTYHTCYEVNCQGTQCLGNSDGNATIEVCYPALVVTGLAECGTSAMYALLAKFPGAITMVEKENCPFKGQQPLWIYFQSLPRMSALGERNIIIDGCITVAKNMQIRELLRYPKTHFIVMSRDYTDMLWAAYNFWCKPEYDGHSCSTMNYWTEPAVHQRSPALFHDLLYADKYHTAGVIQPFWYPMEKPCIHARNYYTGFIKYLHNYKLRNHIITVASEELDLYPLQVALRVASFLKYN